MTRDEIIRILTEHRAELEELGVKSLSLFGSAARGETTSGSDVDLLVEFSVPVGLFRSSTSRRSWRTCLAAKSIS